MITSLATLGVALISAISTVVVAIIQNNVNKKAKTSEQINQEIKNAVNDLGNTLTKKIDNNILNQDKRFLIQFMDKAEKEIEISEEEMRVAFETKEEYNALGGDSYVDTKWDMLIENKIIKL